MSPRKSNVLNANSAIANPAAILSLLDAPHAPSDAGEELSELEVQQLLEHRDKEEAAMEPVAAGVPDSLPKTDAEYLREGAEEVAVLLGELAPELVICSHCKGAGFLPATQESAPPLPTPLHALDSAPENSKIVVVLLDGKSHAVLAGPSGAKELPKDDVAHRLPEGARILKLTDGQGYEATQMSPTVDFPPLRTASAGEAIAQFIAHFHPNGLS